MDESRRTGVRVPEEILRSASQLLTTSNRAMATALCLRGQILLLTGAAGMGDQKGETR